MKKQLLALMVISTFSLYGVKGKKRQQALAARKQREQAARSQAQQAAAAAQPMQAAQAPTLFCRICRKGNATPCSGCGHVHYCSVVCAAYDRDELFHANECQGFKEFVSVVFPAIDPVIKQHEESFCGGPEGRFLQKYPQENIVLWCTSFSPLFELNRFHLEPHTLSIYPIDDNDDVNCAIIKEASAHIASQSCIGQKSKLLPDIQQMQALMNIDRDFKLSVLQMAKLFEATEPKLIRQYAIPIQLDNGQVMMLPMNQMAIQKIPIIFSRYYFFHRAFERICTKFNVPVRRPDPRRAVLISKQNPREALASLGDLHVNGVEDETAAAAQQTALKQLACRLQEIKKASTAE